MIPIFEQENRRLQRFRSFTKHLRLPTTLHEKCLMINHRKKTIFIHVPKTAGTSLSRALEEPKDHSHSTMSALIEAELLRKTLFLLRREKERRIKKYFKFGFVRNPWDRMVSLYFEKQQTGWLNDNITFYDFMTHVFTSSHTISKDPNLSNHAKPCFDWLSENGALKVDFVGRFESLKTDYIKLCRKIKVEPVDLEKIRKRDREHYSTYYNEKTTQLVAKYHAADIEAFGYMFKKE